jgi:hypothetical protein
MTDTKNTGGPAFPRAGDAYIASQVGMSLREYAAIKLCVPDSGREWLDDMIRASLRDRLAGQVFASLGTWIPANGGGDLGGVQAMKARSDFAYTQADFLLLERDK